MPVAFPDDQLSWNWHVSERNKSSHSVFFPYPQLPVKLIDSSYTSKFKNTWQLSWNWIICACKSLDSLSKEFAVFMTFPGQFLDLACQRKLAQLKADYLQPVWFEGHNGLSIVLRWTVIFVLRYYSCKPCVLKLTRCKGWSVCNLSHDQSFTSWFSKLCSALHLPVLPNSVSENENRLGWFLCPQYAQICTIGDSGFACSRKNHLDHRCERLEVFPVCYGKLTEYYCTA